MDLRASAVETSPPGDVQPNADRLTVSALPGAADDGDQGACPRYKLAPNTAHVDDATLLEISGAVASRSLPGAYWIHQDSGAAPELSLIDSSGHLMGKVLLRGADAVDWEDIAVVDPPPDATGTEQAKVSRIIAADIGDNLERRSEIALYIIDEPSAIASPLMEVAAHKLVLRYPDRPHNAEALLIDPWSQRLLIVTKVDTATSQIFGAPLSALHEESATLEESGTLTLPTTPIPGGFRITAADLRHDGLRALIRTYVNAYEWVIVPGQDLAAALSGPPCSVPLALETQGEAIAYQLDGAGYITISEGTAPAIWHFQLDHD